MEQVERLTKFGSAKTETQSYQPNWMNRPDHSRNQTNGNRIPKGNCFACGQPGHYKNACPKIKKAQNNQKNEQQETSQSRVRRLVVSKGGGWLIPGVVEGVEVEMGWWMSPWWKAGSKQPSSFRQTQTGPINRLRIIYLI